MGFHEREGGMLDGKDLKEEESGLVVKIHSGWGQWCARGRILQFIW